MDFTKLLRQFAMCIFCVVMIQVFLFFKSSNTVQNQYLVLQSHVRNAISVMLLDEESLRDYYKQKNLTNIIKRYHESGVYDNDAIDEDEHHDYVDWELVERISKRKSEDDVPIDVIKNLSRTNLQKGLVIDWWYDLCFKQTVWERTWHPLVPYLAQNQTIAPVAFEKEKITGNYMRRIYGFVVPTYTGVYEIELMSRDGAEMMVLDTHRTVKNTDGLIEAIESSSMMAYYKLSKQDMNDQDSEGDQMYRLKPQKLFLKAGTLYFLEILQGGDLSTQFRVSWRRHKHDKFTVIGDSNIFYTKEIQQKIVPSKLYQKSKPKELFLVEDDERRRLSFYKIPKLKGAEKKVRNSGFLCEQTELSPKRIPKLYDGYKKGIENTMSYPREFFLFKYKSKFRDMLIRKTEAVRVAEQMFKRLNALYNGNLRLDHIVHVQKNSNKTNNNWFDKWVGYDDWRDTYYFVELDVRMEDDFQNKVFRTSHFIRHSPRNGTCFIREYEARDNATIHLITPIRNQYVWLKYLVRSLERLVSKVKEYNINLIVVDSNSKDGDYREVLKQSKLRHLYLHLPDVKFSKVKALNYGMSHVKDENSIVFIQDLHLQLPLNIFDRIRKLTIQGKTAFAPTLMKLACGEHEQYTTLKNTVWLDDGTGMLAMYRSDFTAIGGFNEKLFDTKWGGEDWEIIDRIIGNGLYVIHHRLPRFYHVHHPKRGMWNT